MGLMAAVWSCFPFFQGGLECSSQELKQERTEAIELEQAGAGPLMLLYVQNISPSAALAEASLCHLFPLCSMAAGVFC